MVLYTMLMISQSIGEYSTDAKKFLKLIIYRLRQCHGIRLHHRFAKQNALFLPGEVNKTPVDPSQAKCDTNRETMHTFGVEPPLELSSPIAFLLIRLIHELMRKKLFIGEQTVFIINDVKRSMVAWISSTLLPWKASTATLKNKAFN